MYYDPYKQNYGSEGWGDLITLLTIIIGLFLLLWFNIPGSESVVLPADYQADYGRLGN